MKNYVYLLITPMLFSMVSCGKQLPPRKSGQFVNVTFLGNNVECNCPTFAPIGRDLDLKLEIPFVDHEDATWDRVPTADDEGMLDKPVEEYYVRPEDIHVKIAGKEYRDAWYFYYRHNDDNLLKIKKEYMVNDVTIEVSAVPFGDLFLYGIVIGDEMWNRWVDSEKVGSDYPHDLQIDLQTLYQSKPYPIKTLSAQVTFPVLEHDNIDIKFSVIDYDHPPLPDDIRFRYNSRYAYMGVDYTREYLDQYTYHAGQPDQITGYRTCHLQVPHYIVNDHVSFRQYGTE